MKDEALKLAIGALGCIEYGPIGIENGPSEDTTEFTITALREALAEQSAQEPHEYDWSMLEAAKESLREHMARIKELEAALAQPAQEPPSEWAGIKAILDEYGLQAIDFVADFKEALAQPAQEPFTYYDSVRDAIRPFGSDGDIPLYTAPPQSEWNAALEEAAARIGEIKGFGKATQDSFAVYIHGLKK